MIICVCVFYLEREREREREREIENKCSRAINNPKHTHSVDRDPQF